MITYIFTKKAPVKMLRLADKINVDMKFYPQFLEIVTKAGDS